MSNELMPTGGATPAPLASAAPMNGMAWSRQGREMAKMDGRTEMQARSDFNNARLEAHRIQLESVLDKARNDARAGVTQDVMLHVTAVHRLVGQLAGGDPGLELQLREIQAAYQNGESMRIMRRDMNL